MSNRHLSRTLAMQTLFAWDFNGKNSEQLLDILDKTFDNFAPEFNDHNFTKNLVQGILIIWQKLMNGSVRAQQNGLSNRSL